MRIAKVFGTVTLNRSIKPLSGASLKWVCPLNREDVASVAADDDASISLAESLVAWDLIGVGSGAVVAISEGPEASMPFRPDIKPIDTSIVALLDQIDL